MIDSTLQKTIPFISISELKENYNNYTILDTRELNEYNISHLEDAIHVGYSQFRIRKKLKVIATEKPIVVYCSIGYRSEKIGEKILQKGYTVYNLYGGIFDWKNNDHKVIDSTNTVTNRVHCFNENWGKWLLKGDKVYD